MEMKAIHGVIRKSPLSDSISSL